MSLKNKISMLFFVSVSFSAFAWSPNFSVGLGSGFDFYGDSAAKNRRDDLDLKNFCNLYFEANLLFPIGDRFSISLGVDDVFSFVWDGTDYYDVADIAFNFGMRFLPGFYGLSLGADYCICHRTDFVDISGEDKVTKNSKWGNGFKLSVEYDFLYKRKGFSPVAGVSWRFMPRGDKIFDNFLIFYVKLLRKR